MIVSCKNEPNKSVKKVVTKQELIHKNRQSTRVEADQIEKYISRRGWEMTCLKSGVNYMIYESGKTQNQPKDKDTVYVNYSVSLINGKTIYSSDSTKLASFVVGHDNVESGLQEGIKYMSVGDKAMLIIPSHLAHGYTGDFNKIPSNATVIFDITLVRINE